MLWAGTPLLFLHASFIPCITLIVLFLSLDNTQTQSEVNLYAHIHSHLFMISVSCTKAVCSSDFLPRPLELVDVLSTCAKRIILRIFLYFGLITRFITTTFMHLSVFFQFSGFAIIFSVCECGYTKLMVPTAIKRQHSFRSQFFPFTVVFPGFGSLRTPDWLDHNNLACFTVLPL